MFRIFVSLIFTAILATTAAAQSSYRLKSGDTLQVEVLEDPSLNREALIAPDGNISFPLVGTVRAGGRTVDQVRAALVAGLTSNFAAEPNVFVSLGELRPVVPAGPQAPAVMPVYLMGEIGNPGRLDAAPGATILQALAQAGGFSRFAATRRIELRRIDTDGVEKRYLFNYDGGASKVRSIPPTTKLAPGDVIVVPTRHLFE